MVRCELRWFAAWLGLVAASATACGDDPAGPWSAGAGGDDAAGPTTSAASASSASTGAGGNPTGTGSLEFTWLVDRDENCPPGEPVHLSLSGPTGVIEEVPCESYHHVITGLAAGQYTMTIELDVGSQIVGYALNPFSIGAGPFVFPEPLDLGKCSFGGCGTQSIGCVDDGKCTAEDDCVCADCDNNHYCNDGVPRNCNDGLCEPYYEGCSCPDCMQEPVCTG